MPLIRMRRTGEVYTFRLYWQVARRQLANARANQRGSINDLMPALAFAAFTVEAYLDFAGMKLEPQSWAKTKNRNFHQKVEAVLNELGRPVPDEQSDPYRSVLYLKDLRNELAHGKPHIRDEIVEFDDADPASMPAGYTDLFVQIPLYQRLSESGLEGAEVAIAQAEIFINSIHSDLVLRLPGMALANDAPLQGPLSDVRHDSRLVR